MCGKNIAWVVVDDKISGSPPRVREKLNLKSGASRPFRITPACAGKTPYTLIYTKKVQDHPRVCGKNLFKELKQAYGRGSPPRVREKLLSEILTIVLVGITPVCAGKTLCFRYWFG